MLAVLAGVLLSGALGMVASELLGAGKPHIVVFVIDTLRGDFVGAYGGAGRATASIDRFAARGTLYENAYSSSPWTRTSVASLFTGLTPQEHGVLTEKGPRSRLPGTLPTLAEGLGRAGYRTVAISANPHIRPSEGFARGFHRFENVPSSTANTTSETTTAILDAIKGEDAAAPTFFYFHYLDPHDPYEHLPECAERMRDVTTSNPFVRLGSARVLSGEREIHDQLQGGALPTAHALSGDDLEYLEALYSCEIALVDEHFGAVMSELERRGFTDNALVIVTSDHGEEFLEHGRLRHGYQVYEESVRVPLIVRRPDGVGAGKRVETPVSLDRLYTTLLVAGGAANRGSSASLPLANSAETVPVVGMTAFRRQHKEFAVEGETKVIWDGNSNAAECYDLGDDPGEKTPLDVDRTPGARRLLESLRRLGGGQAPIGGAPEPPAPQEHELDESTKTQLRNLGYVE